MGKAVSDPGGILRLGGGGEAEVRMASDINFAPSCPQENYELYSVELGSGPGGDMAAKMSKKKAGGGGGKKKEKLENMKKEMEIVSMGAGVWAGLRWGPEARLWAGWGCEKPTRSVLLHPPERPPAVRV